MAKCYDCGLRYGCIGWIEAIVPDKVISGDPNDYLHILRDWEYKL